MNFKNAVSFDIECYRNYFLLMFKKLSSGQVIAFEKYKNSEPINLKSVRYLLNKYKLISFNGNKYDVLLCEGLLDGYNNLQLKNLSNLIIDNNQQPWEVRKQLGLVKLHLDHIDLIEVAPLKASLKMYGGRLHSKTMQDLPVKPDAKLTKSQRKAIIPYCENDNDVNILLAKRLEGELDLRATMSKEIGVDLMSKSDAQIAEAVIKHEMKRLHGITPRKPKSVKNPTFKYKKPRNIVFKTKKMKRVLKDILNSEFGIQTNGHIELPKSLRNYKFELGASTYKIGVGGLHSCEKHTCHVAGEYLLKDYDVASYYPRIILNNKLAPTHLGDVFLDIYESIVERRLRAKAKGIKKEAATLKIVINGLFGKFGSHYSFVYAPKLLLQVTLTGQLTLLMLVEQLMLKGVDVVSGNTDGIVVKMRPDQEQLVEEIVFDWEGQTGYEMDSTSYSGLYSASVNSYIAVTTSGKVKAKGEFAHNRDSDGVYNLHINPANEISSFAVKEYLSKEIPIEKTINKCDDITKFVTIRTVNGGCGTECETVEPDDYDTQIELIDEAGFYLDEDSNKYFDPSSKAKNGMTENAAFKRAFKKLTVKSVSNEIGKAVRWYYGKDKETPLYYMTNGNKVPRSDGAVPLMTLPDKLPSDLDYDWYIDEAYNMLKQLGVDVL